MWRRSVAPLGLGRVGDRVEQFEPVGVGHGADPFDVALVVQHLLERVGQIQVVQRRRQHAVRDAAFQLGEEAIVGQDADVAVETRVAALFQQPRQVAAQGPGVAGIAFE